MAVIQIREHERLSIGPCTDTQKSITERQAIALRNIEKTLPKGTLRWEHKGVKFNQYCGVIAIGRDLIEVLPKVFGRETEPGISREVLVKMLYVSRQLVPKAHGSAAINLQSNYLLDVFINQFCDLVFEQVHQGLVKIYVEQESNLHVLRGRILTSHQFRFNVAHKERMYCAYDELLENNPYNQVIKTTLLILNQLVQSATIQRKILELIFIFDDVSDVKFTAQELNELPINRIIQRYEHVLTMCGWFLSGLKPDVVAGKCPTLSLLFDMNRLFESCIAHYLRKVSRSMGLELKEQKPQKYLASDDMLGRNVFLMKPDITLCGEGGELKYILDTKWKILDSREATLGVTQSDMYQMHAYASQYDCRHLALIYPKHMGVIGKKRTFVIHKGEYRIAIWTIDLSGLAGIGESIETQVQNQIETMLDSKNSLVRTK